MLLDDLEKVKSLSDERKSIKYALDMLSKESTKIQVTMTLTTPPKVGEFRISMNYSLEEVVEELYMRLGLVEEELKKYGVQI